MTTDRRLIEDFIPIREISVQAAREKSIRKGHISTLHLWWARRPLVAARAAVFASLVAAPETPQKRTALSKAMVELCKWEAGEETIKKARRQILEAQRDRLGLPTDTPLKDVPPPKVLDMFAGGGAIPLESLRLGCETYAVDLNPVAHIIELCTLVYPQKYGKKLADEVEKWGNWVIEQVREEIGDLYPPIKIGEVAAEKTEQLSLLGSGKSKQLNLAQSLTPVAYLWTRTVKCPNPACGAQVPLVRQTWLCKKKDKYVALKTIPNHETKRVEFEVVESRTEKGLGFDPAAGSSRGNSTCRHCGATLDVKHIKKEGVAGRISQQPMAIVCTTAGAQGKTYLAGKQFDRYIPDESQLQERLNKLCEETKLTIPTEPLPEYGTLGFRVQPYGLLKWADLFTSRQLLALMTFVKWVRVAHEKMMQEGYEDEFGKAISTYLGILCDRLADYNSSITHWHGGRELIGNTFTRQALPMVWDFAEINPLGNASGNVSGALDWILQVIRQESNSNNPAITKRGSSMALPIESESLDAVITDPPYFDSVPYADLSDFFYVWLKRSVGHLYLEHFSAQLTPKKNEAIMEPTRHGGDKKKAAKAYEDMMHQAFCEGKRVLKPEGMMVVVYAHKTTSGWSTLIDSLRRAGFTITEAWPLDTEMGSRLRAANSAALASSIFLVARKRPSPLAPLPRERGTDLTPAPLLPREKGLGDEGNIGDYATNVRPQLSQIVRERVATLMAEGVTGADLVIACIGAGLRAYTQYERVELPNGEELDANSFLGEVQKEVVEAALTSVMQCDRRGVSLVDKPTQYYIMGRYEYGELAVEFDEANTLAKGVGVELDGVGGLTDGKLALVTKAKTTIQLRDYSDRGALEDLGIQRTEGRQTFNVKPQEIGAAPTLIDVLHRLLWLADHKPSEIPVFLNLAQPDATQLRLVAQALAGRALTPEPGQETTTTQRTKEQAAIDTLLASWKRLVEDNLFTQGR
ncbi:DUF1156 domain-containing protein [Phormidesmis priestleyi ULC007]|uniref:DUF1156 domain-containing protein n=1 Tax=Phormidesmis priestleyi ULC007 TaxID=1920490 RepID=A0A2T1D466_9CYAN|nr:DUF1156 domain-containing protein [Phormidesmis priestleyi]PSB15315.1 DUF1156 domain-containing protein [Phormidesmis priestleyi ULC007]